MMRRLCSVSISLLGRIFRGLVMALALPALAQPANDNPCGALLPGNTDLAFTMVGATASNVPLDCNPGLNDVWFRASINDAVSVTVLNPTFSPVISVYVRRFVDCASLPLAPIACSSLEDGSSLHVNLPSSITIGDEYFIRVASANNVAGTGSIRVNYTTTFATVTYQGELRENNALYTGNVDVAFDVFDSATGGTRLQTTSTNLDLPTSLGRFTCLVKIKPQVFDGREVYLEPKVRRNGSGDPFTTLSPRQRIVAVPHALIAHEAESIERALAGNGSAFTASRSDHTHTSLTTTPGGVSRSKPPPTATWVSERPSPRLGSTSATAFPASHPRPARRPRSSARPPIMCKSSRPTPTSGVWSSAHRSRVSRQACITPTPRA